MIILDCSVSGGVATARDSGGMTYKVPDAVIQSMGAKPSEGKLVISGEFAVYIVNTQPDLQYLIDKVGELVDQVEALSLVGVSRTPDTAPLSPDVTAKAKALKLELEGFKLI